MIPRFRAFLFAVVVTTFSAAPLVGQQKVPLDHSVYDGWKSISARAISTDGRWVLYRLTPGLGDSELHVRNIESGQTFEIDRGNAARFSQDSRFVVFAIQPVDSIVKDLRLKKTKAADLPKDSLGILALASGTITRVERVKSFAMPAEASGWVAYLLDAPAEEPSDSSEAQGGQDGDGFLQRGDDEDKKEEGTPLVVRNLATGAESRFEDVTTYAFADDGSRLAYAASNKEGDADGTFVVTPGSDTAEPLMVGKGVYKNLAVDDDGDQVAFLSNRDDFEADQPAFALYHWESGDGEASAVADGSTRGVPTGWWVSENGTPAFSENGKRLFFGTTRRPAPEPEEVPEWEKVELDVWNWKDPLLQPNQLVQRQQELRRTYRAMVDLDNNRVVQLATINMPTVTVADSGNGDIALAVTSMPYRQRISWDSPGYSDVYVVDVNTGRARMVLGEIQASAQLSPGGKYITWWDGHQRAWFAKSVDGGEAVNLTGAIAYSFNDELHDRPMIPGSNGSAGWTEDDERFLIYDKHDIWAVDPTGRDAPRNITEGVGRRENPRFRYVTLDRAGGFLGFGGGGGGGFGTRAQDVIDDGDDLLLSAFDLESKSSGFYRDRVRGNREPQRIVMEPHRFGTPQKAKDADVVIFTRESFREFPDLWASDLSFDDAQRLSRANPQQDDYNWGTAELMDWTSTDGLPLQGLLFKPDNFDPNRKYPMMVYYYEKNSDQLHRHRAPSPGSSSINISLYVSRGYVVFIPDIFYRDGYPGESALNCLVPGVLSIIAQGYIDPERVGAQGHSWGGYQNAYLVTRTNIFAAVEAGAPVSNMTSAYGGIRWQSGRSRAMQYEKTQSRMGGSLWEVRPRYIENSPVFWADKVETPVLMMHNDEDGAVPWYQGIEFFVALRRLHKPVWLLNYNGEAHGLRKYQNRKDFAVRMQQFFDHYLMGAPAPVWLEEGIPAVKKGKDLGLQVITKATTSGGR